LGRDQFVLPSADWLAKKDRTTDIRRPDRLIPVTLTAPSGPLKLEMSRREAADRSFHERTRKELTGPPRALAMVESRAGRCVRWQNAVSAAAALIGRRSR